MDIMNDLTLFDMSMGALTDPCRARGGTANDRRVVARHGRRSRWRSTCSATTSSAATGSRRASRPTRRSMTLYASTQGLFGIMADIGTRVIAVYVIFGSLLMAIGAGNVFMRAAHAGRRPRFGGPAKVAVVTSALFGTISGSAVANVMSVGTITIPTMNRAGYRRDLPPASRPARRRAARSCRRSWAPALSSWPSCSTSRTSGRHAAAIPAILYFGRHLLQHRLLRARHRARHGRNAPARRATSPVKAMPARDSRRCSLVGMLFSGYTPTFAGGAATAR